MATAITRAVKRAEGPAEDAAERLSEQLAALREEVASISEAVSSYSGDHFANARRDVTRIAGQVQRTSAAAAREAGHVVRENPAPTIAVLATIALLAALIFKHD
ncbi:MAG TPA: hypothetical protein VGM83_06240 [Devosiaceae bacterium]|jgi:ElaB/YqjD/DUF883 family membrane-anchored ribosome-binding protein